MCALVLGEHGVRVEGGGAVRAAARAHAVVAVAVREQRRARAVARRAARALEAPRALVRHHVPRELTPMTRFVFFFCSYDQSRNASQASTSHHKHEEEETFEWACLSLQALVILLIVSVLYILVNQKKLMVSAASQ